MRVHWIVSAELLVAATAAFYYYYYLPLPFTVPSPPSSQEISYNGGQTVLSWPHRIFVGKLSEYDNVLSAYLMFDYLRSDTCLRSRQVLMTANDAAGGPPYRIWVRLPDDTLAGVEELAQLKANHLASELEGSWITRDEYSDDLRQTNVFVEVYNKPDFPEMGAIAFDELRTYVRQFICFKASVDPRTWESDRDPLSTPRLEDANGLAADIVRVARFYDLPVDALLGIGAMENNFLDAPGDLNNAIWKKTVETDDIVLRRRGRAAWVLNSSMGTWQITRQSMRYAQQLFLCDTRDYSRLPFELHPTEELNMNFLSSHVLTTYAALLLRDLADYFDGNMFLAAAAYNGTKAHPNFQYASGVENVASYARRVIGNTARLRAENYRKRLRHDEPHRQNLSTEFDSLVAEQH